MAYTKADVKAEVLDLISENLHSWMFDSTETMRDGVLWLDGVMDATDTIINYLEQKEQK